jgi:hypothetical protein
MDYANERQYHLKNKSGANDEVSKDAGFGTQ